jgi:predicted PurR-regulated permease PerM
MAFGAAGVILWGVWLARSALVPFLVGLVLAWLLVPVVNALARLLRTMKITRKHDRLIAVILVYLAGLGALAGIGFVVVPWATGQVQDLIENREEIVEGLETQFEPWNELYRERVPEQVQTGVNEWLDQAGQTAPGIVMDLINQNLSTVFGFIVVPFWLFIYMKDQPRASEWFYNLFPRSVRPDARNLVSNASAVIGGYLRGQLILGIFVGVATGIALYFLDVPYAVPLAVLAGLLEVVTIIGPIISIVIAVAVTLALGTVTQALAVLLLYAGIQQIENYVVVPRIQGRAMNIHPAVMLVLIVAVAALFGLLGVFVVLPVAAILRDSFVYIYRRLEEPIPAAATVLSGLNGKDWAGRAPDAHVTEDVVSPQAAD